MSGGLVALLDDVAALARLAAASVDDVAAAAGRASVKAAGVVVDDTAVTPRYVDGLHPSRELPIIARIAKGSLRNKLLFILPAALLLSQFAPWLLAPILMLGGAFLSYEGAEKVWEIVSGHEKQAPAVVSGGDAEEQVVKNAVRTDFILSAEIMVISLKEVASEPFGLRAAILVVVALAITALVYGVVALIVKMDDVGLSLARRTNPASQRLGRALVRAMPILLRVLSVVGIAAMLWVGGHILLTNLAEVGWHSPYDLVHHLEVGVGGGVLGWLVNTGISAVVGLVVGALIVALLHLRPRREGHAPAH